MQMRPALLAALTAGLLGYSSQPVCGGESPPATLWTCHLTRYVSDATPAVGPDGAIYEPTFEGHLVAIRPDGERKWDFQINSEIKSSPAVADDGTIYFGARDRRFYAVSPGGKLKWMFATGAWVDSSPAIAADGTVYFGSWDNQFYALKPDGARKWSFASGGIIDSSPAIGRDGTIYFGSHDKKLYALNPDGRQKWAFATGGPIVSSPAIGADGTIYFSSTDGNLYALEPDGTERWRYRTGGFTWSSPVLDEAGNIFLSANQIGISVSAGGQKRMNFDYSPVLVDATPAVAANGDIYCSAPWRTLTAYLPNGNTDWRIEVTANLTASPVIATNGTVYVADGKMVYAINSSAGLPPPARSSWPMFRADARHTGRVQIPK